MVTGGAQAGTTYYYYGNDSLGLSYEKSLKANGVTEHKHYISLPGSNGQWLLGQFVQRSGNLAANPASSRAAQELNYFHQDAQGSTVAVSDANGQTLERMAYDPWGDRRNIIGPADPNNLITAEKTDRGYTQHEMLDEVGLVHMNGRIYDPTLGRMLTADILVSYPERSTSFNRYAYALNNPLRFVDPTGWDVLALGPDTVPGYRQKSQAEIDRGNVSSRTTESAVGDVRKMLSEPKGSQWRFEPNTMARATEVYASLQIEDIHNAIDPDKINFDNPQDVLKVSSAVMMSLTGSTFKIKQRAKVQELQKLTYEIKQKKVIDRRVIDPTTGAEVQRVIVDSKGNAMIEPVGGRTGPYPVENLNSPDTHTFYANGSNCCRLNPNGHATVPTPHGHAHAIGTGPYTRGQGPSLDIHGNQVPNNSPLAHFPINY